MRRLFSTFAHGPPGVGLLLMRLSAGMGMVVQGVLALLAGPPLGAVPFQVLSIGLGILLLAGLWTPVAGTLVAAGALWNVFTSGHPWRWIMLATLGRRPGTDRAGRVVHRRTPFWLEATRDSRSKESGLASLMSEFSHP